MTYRLLPHRLLTIRQFDYTADACDILAIYSCNSRSWNILQGLYLVFDPFLAKPIRSLITRHIGHTLETTAAQCHRKRVLYALCTRRSLIHSRSLVVTPPFFPLFDPPHTTLHYALIITSFLLSTTRPTPHIHHSSITVVGIATTQSHHTYLAGDKHLRFPSYFPSSKV